MQCISCGKKLTEKDKVCPKCGKKQPLAETDNIYISSRLALQIDAFMSLICKKFLISSKRVFVLEHILMLHLTLGFFSLFFLLGGLTW